MDFSKMLSQFLIILFNFSLAILYIEANTEIHVFDKIVDSATLIVEKRYNELKLIPA